MIITGKKFSKPAMSRVINGDVQLAAAPDKPSRARLDHILVTIHPEFNRSSLQSFIRAGYVSVDGVVVKKPNTLIEIAPQENTAAQTSSTTKSTAQTAATSTEPLSKIKLNLPPDLADESIKSAKIAASRPETIYEDDNVLVLNKPAGLLSMAKGEYCAEPTLEDYGLLVHRLDRDTSGVVILAKNEPTQTLLRKQFQDRKAHKTYYAIVEGRPAHDEANIDLPILRSVKRPNTFIIDPAGKPSQTYYKVLETTTTPDLNATSATSDTTIHATKPHALSLLQLKPTTGRTHQLRVHLNYLGTPILGDRVYGNASADQNSDHHSDTTHAEPAKNPADRLYLHAASLEITIPNPDDPAGTNQRMIFTAPLPKEFSAFFSTAATTNISAQKGTA